MLDKLFDRPRWQLGLLAVYVFVNASVAAISQVADFARIDVSVNSWEPFIWEYTSAVSLLLVFPLILFTDSRFPLTRASLVRAVPAHLLASIIFSLLHVAGMVGLRKLIYSSVGAQYDFGSVPAELFYEYRKDLLTYVFFLLIIYGFRYLRERSSGANYGVPEERSSGIPEFRVKLAGRERVVKVTDVDWVEAAGNYLLLHVGDKAHPLRETMKRFEERFDETFVRVHRSAIVNRSRISSIRTGHGSGKEVVLDSGEVVPCGRSYQLATERLTSQREI